MTQPCRLCQNGQRISTLTFAIFAVLLSMAAMDPGETAGRSLLFAVCAMLSGLAVIRFQLAAMAGRVVRRPASQTATPSRHGTGR